MVFHILWHNKGHSYITDVLGTCRNFSPRQMLTIPGLLLFFKKLSIVDLQCCVSFRYTAKWLSCVCVCVCVCTLQSVSSVTQLYLTLCNPMNCSMPGLPVLHQLPEFTQTHVHWVGDAMQCNHLILCCPLLSPPLIFPSIRVFPNESILHIRWPKYWSFSFSISPSNEYSCLISFRIDWFDLLAVQGTLKSLLQHHSSKASILRRSAFFIVRLSHPYMTTGKTIALTRRTFVGFPNGSDGKEPSCQCRRHRFNPWRRSPWEGNGNPFQYYCLENPMDRGAWRAIVHAVTKSQTWLNDWACTRT